MAKNTGAEMAEVFNVSPTEIALSSAEILNLHNTPKEIVPAPGADKVIVLHRLVFFLNFGTTAYEVAGNISMTYNDSMSAEVQDLTDLVGNPADGLWMLAARSVSLGANTSDYVNREISIKAFDGAVTAGDGTLKVVVFYSIVSLV